MIVIIKVGGHVFTTTDDKAVGILVGGHVSITSEGGAVGGHVLDVGSLVVGADVVDPDVG